MKSLTRYPQRIPEIIRAIKNNKFILTDNNVLLNMDGVEEAFDLDIILVNYQAKEGEHVASNQGIVVSLDLALTDELKEEGYARDIVRNIQELRKQLGCEITEGIQLEFVTGVPQKWERYICEETLGEINEVLNPDDKIEIELESDKKAVILISKLKNS